jgi:hypothetical protein
MVAWMADLRWIRQDLSVDVKLWPIGDCPFTILLTRHTGRSPVSAAIDQAALARRRLGGGRGRRDGMATGRQWTGRKRELPR